MIITADQLGIEDYHRSAPKFLSKTSIRAYAEHGPAWWHGAYIARTIDRPRPGGATQGIALDTWLTAGQTAFYNAFAVRPPNLDLRTAAGKAWSAEHEGKEALSAEDFAILLDAAIAVERHPRWADIRRCRAQLTCRRLSPSLGLGLQSRPDWLNTDAGLLYDLKTTRDLDSFGRQAIDLGYHLQAAIAGWCLDDDGCVLDSAHLVAVEWKRGARCRVYEIPQAAMEAGHRQMRTLAAEIADRIRRDDWRDQPPTGEPLAIPGWVMQRLEEA